jgi:hypothetical protein
MEEEEGKERELYENIFVQKRAESQEKNKSGLPDYRDRSVFYFETRGFPISNSV